MVVKMPDCANEKFLLSSCEESDEIIVDSNIQNAPVLDRQFLLNTPVSAKDVLAHLNSRKLFRGNTAIRSLAN